MGEDSFPDSATMVNINSLMRGAERIRQKTLPGRYVLPYIFFYAIPTAGGDIFRLFSRFFLGMHSYFNFLLSLPANLQVGLAVVLARARRFPLRERKSKVLSQTQIRKNT